MSVYGFGPFENDDAVEFLDEVGDAAVADRPVLLRAALDQVLRGDGPVGAVEMAEAIAAAAVVVRVLRPDEAPTDLELPEWVTQDPPAVDADLAETARAAMRRVLASEDDALWRQWTPEDATQDPRTGLGPTLRRLAAEPPRGPRRVRRAAGRP